MSFLNLCCYRAMVQIKQEPKESKHKPAAPERGRGRGRKANIIQVNFLFLLLLVCDKNVWWEKN